MAQPFVVMSELYTVAEDQFEGEIDIREIKKISKEPLKIGLVASNSFPAWMRSQMESNGAQPEFLLVAFPDKATVVRKRPRSAAKASKQDEA